MGNTLDNEFSDYWSEEFGPAPMLDNDQAIYNKNDDFVIVLIKDQGEKRLQIAFGKWYVFRKDAVECLSDQVWSKFGREMFLTPPPPKIIRDHRGNITVNERKVKKRGDSWLGSCYYGEYFIVSNQNLEIYNRIRSLMYEVDSNDITIEQLQNNPEKVLENLLSRRNTWEKEIYQPIIELLKEKLHTDDMFIITEHIEKVNNHYWNNIDKQNAPNNTILKMYDDDYFGGKGIIKGSKG